MPLDRPQNAVERRLNSHRAYDSESAKPQAKAQYIASMVETAPSKTSHTYHRERLAPPFRPYADDRSQNQQNQAFMANSPFGKKCE